MDALTFWREKLGVVSDAKKPEARTCGEKKSVCALRGILWSVLAFLVFSCVELDNHELNDIFETLT